MATTLTFEEAKSRSISFEEAKGEEPSVTDTRPQATLEFGEPARSPEELAARTVEARKSLGIRNYKFQKAGGVFDPVLELGKSETRDTHVQVLSKAISDELLPGVDSDKIAPYVAAGLNQAKGIVEFPTSPGGLGLTIAAMGNPVLARLIAAGFGVKGGTELPGAVKRAREAHATGTEQEKADATMGLVGDILMTAGGIKGATTPIRTPASEAGRMLSEDVKSANAVLPTVAKETALEQTLPTPETKTAEVVGPATTQAVAETKGQNASEITENAALYGDVRTQQEPTGELPVTQGSAGVQPQTEGGLQPLQGSEQPQGMVAGTQGAERNQVADLQKVVGSGSHQEIKSAFDKLSNDAADEISEAVDEGKASDVRDALEKYGGEVPKTDAEVLSFANKLKGALRQSILTEASSRITEPGPGSMGITAPIGVMNANVSTGLSGLKNRVSEAVKGMAGESLPKFTGRDREAGEAGVRYGASRVAAPYNAIMFTSRVLETGVDPRMLGTALTEDNLRSIRQNFLDESKKAATEGNKQLADELKQKSDKVRSMIGSRGSPFKTEEEYQAFLSDPATQAAIESHKQLWDSEIEPMYRNAQGLDPEVELPSRGLQTGARINLKALLEDEPGTRVVTAGRGSVLSTFRKKSPFAREAKGTAQRYETDYNEIIANTYYRQLELANQNAFHRTLIEKGLAKVGPKAPDDVAGEAPSKPYPLVRRVILSDGKVIPKNENLYVPKSLESEYRGVSNLDAKLELWPGAKQFVGLLNKGALVSIGELTGHSFNLADALLNSPKGKPIQDALLKATGRADVIPTVFSLIRKSMADNKAQLADLATIGALREPFKGLGPTSKFISWMDRNVRLILDDSYKEMARNGWAKDTETARREFVNQVGQYNTRLQGPIMRSLRDTGLAPFVTAGRAFNVLGAKRIMLKTGVEPSGAAAGLALKANAVGAITGFIVLRTVLNQVLSGSANGRPGTPLMNIDLGTTDKSGKPQSFPLGDLLGPGRGLRVTGLRGAIEAHRTGLNESEQVDAGLRDIASSALMPIWGPSQRFMTTAIAGKQTPFAPPVAPTARPDESQFGLNIGTAAKEFNPFVATAIDLAQGKGVDQRKLQGRLSPMAGRTEAQQQAMPRIVDRAKAKEYKEYIIREAKKLAPEDRGKFIAEKIAGSGLTTRDIKEISRRAR